MENVIDSFSEAIADAGSSAELCRRMTASNPARPVTPQMFVGWRRRKQVPEDRVWQFVQATAIPPWEVRPDLYDRPEIYLSKVAALTAKQMA